MPNDDVHDTSNELGVVFPIKTMGDFILFEEAIATSEEKKNALVSKNIEMTLLYTRYITYICIYL